MVLLWLIYTQIQSIIRKCKAARDDRVRVWSTVDLGLEFSIRVYRRGLWSVLWMIVYMVRVGSMVDP